MNKTLTSLHPLGLITLEDLRNEENNSLNELAFCPKDLAQCWMSINSIFGNSIYKDRFLNSSHFHQKNISNNSIPIVLL